MSENYRIVAVGREEFFLPFAAVGFEFYRADDLDAAIKYIAAQDFARTLVILDEDIVDDDGKVSELESAGANILVLKAWDKSETAGRKIRQASIEAIGVDIKES